MMFVVPMEATVAAQPGSCTPDSGVPVIDHDFSLSYCELCGRGEVHLVITNPLGVDLTTLSVVEDLRASGLTYVPGSTRFVGTYVTAPAPFEPVVSGTNGSVLTWAFGGFELPGPSNPSQSNRHSSLEIIFDVQRHPGLSEEGLVWANRDIRGSVSYRSVCSASVQTATTGLEELPVQQPVPRVYKRGRNIDAAQGSYSDPVYGNTDDDVIWRIQVSNTGTAPMQDVIVSDVMAAGNYLISYACPTDGSAAAVASNNGVAPGGSPCRSVGPTTSITDFRFDPPFGNPPTDPIVDVPEGGSAYLYLVGKVTGSCANRNNTANGLEWGCEVDNPDGGISSPASNGGIVPSFTTTDTATLSTFVNSGLSVQRQITGTNTSQPAGSKGMVTLRISNQTGGTVKNIRLKDMLPPEYVIDPTWWTDTTPPATWSGVSSAYYASRPLTVQPAYGNYAGMVNRITWTNPAPGSLDAGNTDPALPLANVAPEFTLWSSTRNTVDAADAGDDQQNLLRRGDVITITFPIVLVASAYHDKVANLDVREEGAASDPPGTDPLASITLNNHLDIWYEQFCTSGTTHQPFDDTFTARPEDLDVDITGSELVFILTNNPSQALPLTVELTNNGGHDAADYAVFVSFGATMSVTSAPAGCSVTSNPPPLAVWREPAPIPANATVYRCTGNAVAPGQRVPLNFQVVKSTDPLDLAADDLTFRADVVGEITLSNGTPLWFPTPTPRDDGVTDRADNYSLDGIRARVIGFNLLKDPLGYCSEENTPLPTTPDSLVLIGEECTFHIETGGWFGFQTPGFTYIAVQKIQVVDELPANGQASSQRYLASSDPYAQSTSAIRNVSLNPAGLNPLDATSVDWTFNQVVPAERITAKDEWFKVDISTRLLNNGVDTRAAPNVHAAISRNILNSTFEAVFADTDGAEEIYLLGPNTVGYPQQAVRRVDLTVTEPQILIEHEVCNLTRSGGACNDADFHDLATANGLGDAYDEYLYRVVLTNQAAAGGVARAPAYDLIATVMLDPTGLEYVMPFESDGFDNDGDALSDGADTLEGSIADNVFGVRGDQASIRYHHDHSAPLKRVAAGQSVTLYYRVKPYPEVAPGQWLEHTVSVAYDSLAGASGNQSAPTRPTGDIAGARAYTDGAWVRSSMVPVQVEPKQIVRVANTPAQAPLADRPHPVAIGEEVEYELVSYLPVAKLRAFTIVDNLPQGLRCTEAPVIDLGPSGPYAQAQFSPGGTITPTCSDGLVQWQFGDQEITNKASGDDYYRFAIRFIARVENTAFTNDGVIIGNGGNATSVQASYVDEAGATVTLQFGRVDLVVKEPAIALAKTFDVTEADAADELTVTVTATNTGTAAAYNLRVLDDLAAVRNLTFLGSVGGLDPPDVVDTATLGANRPIFRWDPTNPKFTLAPGDTRSFSFKVRVDGGAQPQRILGNTAQANWTSLPSRTIALNTAGSIGSDGSGMGMRNGALPSAGDAINDYETTAQDSVTVPPVTMDKSDRDPAQMPAIGAHKAFRIDIRLPEGTTEGLVVRDNLAAGPLGYVLADNADFDVTYSFQGIASLNGNAPAESALLAVPADGATGTVEWNVGEVVTQSENDLAANAIEPLIRIDYYARIHNAVGTTAGDQLRNAAEVDYLHGETATPITLSDATAMTTVVEPSLGIAKQWANVTAGKGPTDAPVGGDILEYTVTVDNHGNATAHDTNVVDTLGSHLLLDAGFTPKGMIDGSPVTGFVPVPAGAPAGPLVWGRDNGDGSLDIPAGSTLVLIYRTLVANTAEPGQPVGNSVRVDWTSLDAASGYERTGAGCPDITAPDDYCAGPATTSTTLSDANALAKTVVSDSFADAPFSTDADSTVRVGDTAVYRLAITLQGGSTREVRIQDVLPAGMALDAIVSIDGDTTADYAPPAGSSFSFVPVTAANRPAPGASGTLIWNLGTVVASRTDVLEIVYRARVLPDAGLAHVASTTLTNTATLTYLDAGDATVTRTDGADLTARQPVIASVSKTDRSGRTSGEPVQLDETMNFRVSACNTGAAPAYDVRLRDQLPTQLDETSLTGPVNGAGFPDVYFDATLAALTTDYTWTPPSGAGGEWQVDLLKPLAPGQCVHVDYDIGFAAVGLNEAWQNSATVEHYYSLPSASGQQYGPVGPAVFSMHNVAPIYPPEKEAVTTGEVTVGDEVTYRITVPGTGMNAAMSDVVVSDTLHESLVFVDAVDGDGNALTNTASAPNEVRLVLGSIAPLSQKTVVLRARVANNADANAGVAFGNTASYTFANTPGGATIVGGSASTIDTLKIVEPRLTLAKAVQNLSSPGNPPAAGDLLRYTLSVNALGGAGGDEYSDAWDIGVLDTLSAGLAYQGNATVSGANTLGAPVLSGDGVTGQTLRWSPADGNVNIDVAEGGAVQISYDVRVLDGVSANQTLANAAVVYWTGLDAARPHERDGSGTPAYNDYFTAPAVASVQTVDGTQLNKRRLTDTWGAADEDVRIGDVLHYALSATLNEGTTPGAVLVDTLPQGLAYEGVVSINGVTSAPFAAVAPFIHAPLGAPVVSGDARTGPSTITWTLGDVVNAGDGDDGNDQFVIVYAARVLDGALTHLADTALSNTARLDYQTFTGPASRSANHSVTARQPLLVVSKSAVAEQGDDILAAGERVTYTVAIRNTGSAPAYDAVLQDVIPLGMRHGAATLTTVSTTLAGAPVANVEAVYDPVTGLAVWDFDTGTADAYTIPAGAVLRVVYEVQTDANLGAGLTLTNSAQVARYHSFDDEATPGLGGVQGVRQTYGPSNIASTTLYSTAPNPLAKENPQGVTTVAVGEPFRYRITVPATPQAVALHDVRIHDDLTASAADLRYVSVQRVSGSQPWTPVNTGTATALVIADGAQGIDIPAGEQIVIDVTVVLPDTTTNTSGLHFQNTAYYSYTAVNGDETTRANGGADTTADLVITGPDNLILEKSGPAQMRTEVPGTFTLDVHNAGTGTAWDLSIVDRLPNPEPGGMCDTPPANITAQVFESDGVTPAGAPLLAGTDFVTAFTGAPGCELTITVRTPAAAPGAGQHLLVSYQAWLDGDNVDATPLTNLAGVTRWYSADTDGSGAGDAREYTRVLSTDAVDAAATPDHEDAHTVTAEMPVLVFQKSVANVTTGQTPGTDATPGDVLRYSVRITNVSSVALSSFSLQDELDRLNADAMFAPGSLQLVTVPAGADTGATDAAGGARGTGLVDIRNLSLDAQGGANDSLLVEFEARLAPVITSGSVVLNQAQLVSPVVHTLNSDDPDVNGADQPDVLGDEDPTATLIASAPQFRVQKISDDVTGDPAMLMAGDTLRYTLTVKNVGSENAADVMLQDAIPAHTRYVPGSTRLNGVAVPDAAAGVSPLRYGMLLHAPEDATPGALRADADAAADNVATVSFDVRIDTNVVDGTPITNQGFVTGTGLGGGATGLTPSDDPDTPAADDPTRDVVGNLPLLDVMKTVSIVDDQGSPGFVDPGDVLRYTFTVTNTAGTPATGVVLRDALPPELTYLADSTVLNGLPVGQPDGGVPPLTAGLAVSSSDRTPPLPSGSTGIVSAHGTAVLTFDARVNAVASGTPIRNQGVLSANELLDDEPSDADGIDSNGDQVTEVIVGAVQQLAITKEVFVVNGSTAQPGGELRYVVRVRNTGNLPATHVLITDDLNQLAGVASYVPGSAELEGAATGIVMPGGVLTADYSTLYGALQPGETAEMSFNVRLEPALAAGTRITNTAQVGWDSPRRHASASVSIDIGGTPGSVNLDGHVWHDGNLDGAADSGEAHMAGWMVEVLRAGTVLGTTLTDDTGRFAFAGLAPNDPSGEAYVLRITAPGASIGNTAPLGWAGSDFAGCSKAPTGPCWRTGMQRVTDIVAPAGSHVRTYLPLQPHGVVYDAVLRVPVAGATLTLVNAANDVALPGRCFEDVAQQGQVTGTDGFYRFDVNFSDAACAAPGNYLIRVTPPADGYMDGPSRIIPPVGTDASNPNGTVYSVPTCADDAVPGTTGLCEVQASASAPATTTGARTRGTHHHINLLLGDAQIPRDSQLFNNPIPVDPQLDTAIAITKTAALVNATRGQIVPYTITVRNTLTAPLQDLSIVDSFPPGFKYVEGSGRVDGEPVEPRRQGLQLMWEGLELDVDAQHTVTLLLIVGSGVSEGDYVNRAQVFNLQTGTPASGEASATVRVVPDATFDCTDIIGKVFDDRNRDGYQDDGEAGLPGVRLVSARGLIITTDEHGRFHITCAVVPDEDRGSNFILKLDDRSLPSGYRITTENPLVLRATRGKMMKFNFGATVHRVVSLGMADEVFEPDAVTMRPQWQPRLGVLVEELRKAASVLRLTYLADVEQQALVERRIEAVKADILRLWQDSACCDPLNIETEIFWRRGAPPERD